MRLLTSCPTADDMTIAELMEDYRRLIEALRTWQHTEPPYSDMQAHRVWEASAAELREDLAKAHTELDVLLFQTQIPDYLPT